HARIVDPTLGSCKVTPTPSGPTLTACAVLPAGFVPGPPAFDKAGNRVYIPDTTAAGAGIVRLTFTPATEVVGTSTTVVTSAQLTAADPLATAPTALAFGPDSQLYVAVAGSSNIIRVTAPSTGNHVIRPIGWI